MKEKILKAFNDSISTKEKFVRENADSIEEVARLIASALNDGKKLMLFGNGGSSSDASHIAAEFVGKSRKDRPGLNAVSLNSNVAVMTALANDYDYSEIFSRQLKAIAEEGDVVIAISTSGNSVNILKAVEAAKRKKLKTIAFAGAKSGKLASKVNYVFSVPSSDTQRVQETHITLGHVLCQIVEEILFEAPRKKRK
ncbi:MAG: D-sedoheptulose-7-phosphate isomerase [Planctomycetota bacterium]|jgi:D-sedoheptulose 7-phosphate isomerase